MKTKIEFAFGVNFDKNGATISPAMAQHAVENLRKELADRAGGCTAFAHIGSWIDPDGKMVSEHGYTLTAVLETDFAWTPDFLVRQIVDSIKQRLNQQSVAVTKTPVDFNVL